MKPEYEHKGGKWKIVQCKYPAELVKPRRRHQQDILLSRIEQDYEQNIWIGKIMDNDKLQKWCTQRMQDKYSPEHQSSNYNLIFNIPKYIHPKDIDSYWLLITYICILTIFWFISEAYNEVRHSTGKLQKILLDIRKPTETEVRPVNNWKNALCLYSLILFSNHDNPKSHYFRMPILCFPPFPIKVEAPQLQQ